jgi:protein O-mannosyl-transferase
VNNPDVIGTNPPWAFLANDFWGASLNQTSSHKSYRPLTTLRSGSSSLDPSSAMMLNNPLARNPQLPLELPPPRVLARGVPPGQRRRARHRMRSGSPPRQVSAAATLAHHATLAGPRVLQTGLRLVVVRVIFQGRERASVVAALLYTVHPLHVESVTPLVGRADLLCGVFYIPALLAYWEATSAQQPRESFSCAWCFASCVAGDILPSP